MELDDKRHFIQSIPPFSDLEESDLDQCLKHLKISFFKAGTTLERGEQQQVFLLRSGSIELREVSGEFFDRLSEGDSFLFPVLSGVTPLNVQVLEDSLVYLFPQQLVNDFASHVPAFARYFGDQSDRALIAREPQGERDFRLNQSVESLMVREPLCTHQSASITQAAQSMSLARVSSILVVDGEQLVGILTDRDLRSRVLAKGVSPSAPVSEVMTEQPRCIKPNQTVYEAQMLMMTSNIHHLPVVSQGRPIGILTLNDFVRAQNSEPIYLIQAIHRADGREALSLISKQLPDLVCKMIVANVRADEIGKVITSITDAITRQLIFLAQRTFGVAPCQFAWVVFGSQARQDQMLGSDQDNGLVLEREPSDEEAEYFRQFARFVNEGLDRAGLKFCPGGIMAMTDKWRQPLDVWKSYFIKWIREPEPKALMHASIFYDIRHVAGERSLIRSLRSLVLEEARKNTIFQACMSENALQSSPPLGFFKKFVLEKDGNHNSVLDLKHRGTVPIVAAVRLYCLAHGIESVNTMERLDELIEQQVLSVSEASNLKDAHEFIASLRLENQSHAIESGAEVNNSLNPDDLSPLVRHQLKDAFSVVAESQRLLKMRFGHGAI